MACRADIKAAFTQAEAAEAKYAEIEVAARHDRAAATASREALLGQARELITTLAPITGKPEDDGGPDAQRHYCRKGEITFNPATDEFTFSWTMEGYDYETGRWSVWEWQSNNPNKSPYRVMRFPARWLTIPVEDVVTEVVAAAEHRLAEKARFRKMAEDAVAAKAAAAREDGERAEYERLRVKFGGGS